MKLNIPSGKPMVLTMLSIGAEGAVSRQSDLLLGGLPSPILLGHLLVWLRSLGCTSLGNEMPRAVPCFDVDLGQILLLASEGGLGAGSIPATESRFSPPWLCQVLSPQPKSRVKPILWAQSSAMSRSTVVVTWWPVLSVNWDALRQETASTRLSPPLSRCG